MVASQQTMWTRQFIAVVFLLTNFCFWHGESVLGAEISGRDVDANEVASHNQLLLRLAGERLEGHDLSNFIRGPNYEEFDILARAEVAVQVKRALRLPEPRSAYLNAPALEAVILSDHFGDFLKGDYYASLVSAGNNLTDPSMINYTLDHLRRTGRVREAKFLEDDIKHQYKYSAPNFGLFPELPANRRLFEEDEQVSRHIQLALRNRDIEGANLDASIIVQRFKEMEIDDFRNGWGILRRQDLACTILDTARRFSDLGSYQESNYLLTELQKGFVIQRNVVHCPKSLIEVEHIVNATRLREPVDVQWSKLEDEIRVVSKETDETSVKLCEYSVAEQFRLLALAFYNSGEFDRAELLITQAFKRFESDVLTDSDQRKIIYGWAAGEDGERLLLTLDAACISARLEKYRKAFSLAKEALNGKVLIDARYGEKIAEIARILGSNGQAMSAQIILEAAHAKFIDPNQIVLSANDFFPPSQVIIDYSLAKILFEEGKVSRAKKLVEAIANDVVNNADNRARSSIANEYEYSAIVLAGAIAELEHDSQSASRKYGQVAHYYPMKFGFYDYSDETAALWLTKAIEYARQSNDFPPDELAGFLLRLAELKRSDSIAEACKYQDEASNLLSESDAKKVHALVTLADMQKSLPKPPLMQRKGARLPVFICGTARRFSVQRYDKANDLTEEERQDRIRANPQIETLRKAAVLSEFQKDPKAFERFLALAAEEERARLSDESKDALLKAIALYPGSHEKAPPAISQEPIPLDAFTLIEQLDENDVKDIARKATKRIELMDGPRSDQCRSQLEAQFKIQVYLEEDDEALKTLDRILTFAMPQIPEADRNGWMNSLGRWREFFSDSVADQIKDLRPRMALAILSKTLVAQKLLLSKNDVQIFQTHWYLANLLSSAEIGNNNEAAVHYKLVLGYLKGHAGEALARSQISSDCLKILGEPLPNSPISQENGEMKKPALQDQKVHKLH